MPYGLDAGAKCGMDAASVNLIIHDYSSLIRESNKIIIPRDMLVCVLLLMAVLMESVELQLPPPQPLAQHQHQRRLQPRQVPPQHQRPQHQQRLLPPPPPSPALCQDQHVGLLRLVQWEVPTVVPMLMEHLTIVQLALGATLTVLNSFNP